MPGSPMIGIGPALRKARENRSKTIDEAARDTKIRAEYLQALERESFDALLGDAYVRGFLRSYSQYLGLDPEKISAAYTKSVGRQAPSEMPEPPEEAERSSSPLKPVDRTRSWIIAGGVALLLIVLFAVFGWLSRSHNAPPAALLPSVPPSMIPTEPQVTVGVIAKHEIEAVVNADGQQVFAGVLHAQEARTFQANRELEVMLARGGVVTLKVNDEDIGAPGDLEHPYTRTFYPPPSPTPSPPEGALP